jgi:hypothetical protein
VPRTTRDSSVERARAGRACRVLSRQEDHQLRACFVGPAWRRSPLPRCPIRRSESFGNPWVRQPSRGNHGDARSRRHAGTRGTRTLGHRRKCHRLAAVGDGPIEGLDRTTLPLRRLRARIGCHQSKGFAVEVARPGMSDSGEDREDKHQVTERHGGRPPGSSRRPAATCQALHVDLGRNICIRDRQATEAVFPVVV